MKHSSLLGSILLDTTAYPLLASAYLGGVEKKSTSAMFSLRLVVNSCWEVGTLGTRILSRDERFQQAHRHESY